MLEVSRLRLQLPAGFEHRASSIARLLGESLAEVPTLESRTLESLEIGPVRVVPDETDMEIANRIANQIASMLGDGS